MSPQQVRVFATPMKNNWFKACITDASDVSVTLHLGRTKQPSVAAACHEARRVAELRGWQVVR